MNLSTPYDVFFSLFHTIWRSGKEDGKDYFFDMFCDLLIRGHQKLLDEVNLGGKHQAHLVNIFGPW